MTKHEWGVILKYYQDTCQLDNLPTVEYTKNAFEELKHLDARFVFFAVRNITRTENPYNKYPNVNLILKYIPDFESYSIILSNKTERLIALLDEHLPENHWYYKHQINKILALYKELFNEEIEIDRLKSMTDRTSFIWNKTQKSLEDTIDGFFNKNGVHKQLKSIAG